MNLHDRRDLRDDEGVVLAVDLGGTKVEAALVAPGGRIIGESASRRATGAEQERDDIAAAIVGVVEHALQAVPNGFVVRAVGIGSAGPVNRSTGSISPVNLPSLHEFPIRDLIAAHVPSVPVRLALDGTCIALAEHRLGAAAGARNSLSMVISTGIGGGFVIDGRVVHGATGNAGHIGQMRIDRGRGADPHDGTLESIASGTRTVAWARAQGWRGSTGEELADAYTAGDRIARDAVVRSAEAVGDAIANAATLLDLDVVVLAGGFVNVAVDYVAMARDRAREAAVLPYARTVSVVGTGLGGNGPVLGAALLGILDDTASSIARSEERRW